MVIISFALGGNKRLFARKICGANLGIDNAAAIDLARRIC
jgi:hypothetical protein